MLHGKKKAADNLERKLTEFPFFIHMARGVFEDCGNISCVDWLNDFLSLANSVREMDALFCDTNVMPIYEKDKLEQNCL